MADIWSMPPVRLAELLSPYALGRVEKGAWGFWGLRFYPGQSTPFIYSLYPGLLTTVLAAVVVAAAFRAPRRRVSRAALLWTGAGLVGVGLAAGRFLPFWPLARGLPLVSGLRYPERFVVLLLLPLVVLAARGFDRLLRGHAATRRTAQALLLAAGALFAVAAVAGLLSGAALWAGLGLPAEPAARMPLLAAQDAVVGVFTALAFLVALNGLASRWHWATAALLALAALDLVHAGGRLMRTKAAAEMAAAPPVIRPLLDAAGLGPVFHAAGWVADRESDFSFARPPMPAFWGVATAFEPDFDLTELRWSTAATAAFLEVLQAQPRTGLAVARRRGVAAFIRLRSGVKVVDARVVTPEGADSAVELRFLEGPRPLVYLTPQVEGAAGAAGWMQTVLRPGFSAADTVIVDSADAARVPAVPSSGGVALRDYWPGRIAADVQVLGPSAGVVAVNQTWDEFWSARLDGVACPILKADLSLMAVVVPPGGHRLELAYADPWLARGLTVSAAALLALGALALSPRRAP